MESTTTSQLKTIVLILALVLDATDTAPHHILVYSDKSGPVVVPTGPSVQSFGTTGVTIEFQTNDRAGELTVYRLDTAAPNTTLRSYRNTGSFEDWRILILPQP